MMTNHYLIMVYINYNYIMMNIVKSDGETLHVVKKPDDAPQ
jgi:hypothetical protein